MKIPQSTIDRIAEYVNENPVHQTAHATADDINLLRQEIQANSIDIDSQLSIISGIILRLDAIESQLNHRNP